MGPVAVRHGGPADEPALYELFDEAVEWLVARGQPGQWGDEPPSQSEGWRTRIHGIAADGDLWLLEAGGETLGALAVGSAPDYVPAIEEPELYVLLLITRRSHKGEKLGERLLEVASEIAERAGAVVMRVDCWAGSPSLVAWYESQGFERSGRFNPNGWPLQLFRRPVA